LKNKMESYPWIVKRVCVPKGPAFPEESINLTVLQSAEIPLDEEGNVQSENVSFFIHGITSNAKASVSFVRCMLKARKAPFCMISIDLRGRGTSDKPEEPTAYGMEQHARDIIAVIHSYGLGKVMIVGHSMGGFVAMQLAYMSPELVRGLVLLDTGKPREEGVSEVDEDIQKGLQKAFLRLGMHFPDLRSYLIYWAGSEEAADALSVDLIDYYAHELAENGYPTPSCVGARMDVTDLVTNFFTAKEFKNIRTPMILLRAGHGFADGAKPFVGDAAAKVIKENLDIREELLISDANHYSITYIEFVDQCVAATLRLEAALEEK
jgi:lipase